MYRIRLRFGGVDVSGEADAIYDQSSTIHPPSRKTRCQLDRPAPQSPNHRSAGNIDPGNNIMPSDPHARECRDAIMVGLMHSDAVLLFVFAISNRRILLRSIAIEGRPCPSVGSRGKPLAICELSCGSPVIGYRHASIFSQADKPTSRARLLPPVRRSCVYAIEGWAYSSRAKQLSEYPLGTFRTSAVEITETGSDRQA